MIQIAELTKLDFWAIAANEVYKACRRAGMDEGTALAFIALAFILYTF